MVRTVDLSNRATGRVVTPDGKPVAEANVSVSSYVKDANGNQSDYKSEYLETGKEGRFVLPLLRPKSIMSVNISKWEHKTTATGMVGTSLTVADDGKQPVFNDWVLTPLTGSVAGKIISNVSSG